MSTLKRFKAVSVLKGPVFQSAQPWRVPVRSFSGVIEEPQYMCDEEGLLQPQVIRIPYLRDTVRQEIYARYITDPEKWTFAALSAHYQASLDRVKAVVLLMHHRYEFMKNEMGFTVDIVSNGENSIPKVVVTIPPLWRALHEKHLAAPEDPLTKLLADHNASVVAEEDKTSMNEEELKKILAKMADHDRRTENLKDYEEDMEEKLKRIEMSGVNTRFAEVPAVPANYDFQSNYFPPLLGDEEFEEEKKILLKRVAEETSAIVRPNVHTYVQQHEDLKDVKITNMEARKTEPIRWKLAFRELTPDGKKQPTVIRTRTGSIRRATPLEEMQRSWNARPLPMDVQLAETFEHFSEKLVKPYTDVDKEDHLTSRISLSMRDKRKKAKEAADAKGK